MDARQTGVSDGKTETARPYSPWRARNDSAGVRSESAAASKASAVSPSTTTSTSFRAAPFRVTRPASGQSFARMRRPAYRLPSRRRCRAASAGTASASRWPTSGTSANAATTTAAIPTRIAVPARVPPRSRVARTTRAAAPPPRTPPTAPPTASGQPASTAPSTAAPPAASTTTAAIPARETPRIAANSTPSATPRPTKTPTVYQPPMQPSLGRGVGAALEPRDNGEPELGRALPVDHAVVEGDRDVPHPADHDLALAHDRTLADPMHAEDPHLRRIDQRRHQDPGELARARDREGAAAELLRLQAALARRLGETRHLSLELLERGRIAVAHDRNDQPVVGRDRDADVVAVEVDQLVAVDARVELGVFLERQRRRAQREGDEPPQVDVSEITLVDPRDRRDVAVCTRHVLGHQAADAADPLPPLARGRRSEPRRRPADVVLGHSPLWPATGDRGEVDAELLGEAPDERRRAHAAVGDTAEGLSLGHGRSGRGLLRRRLGPRLRAIFRRGAVADDDEHGADRHDFPFADQDPADAARGRRGNLDRGLVGLDLDECLVLSDLVPLGHEPAGDLALRQALAEVGQLQLVGHPAPEPIPQSESRRPEGRRGRPWRR